jgi:hypothetical protein
MLLASSSFEMQCLIIFPFDVVIFRMRRFIIGERRFSRSSVAEPRKAPGGIAIIGRRRAKRARPARRPPCISNEEARLHRNLSLREARLVHASLFML